MQTQKQPVSIGRLPMRRPNATSGACGLHVLPLMPDARQTRSDHRDYRARTAPIWRSCSSAKGYEVHGIVRRVALEDPGAPALPATRIRPA